MIRRVYNQILIMMNFSISYEFQKDNNSTFFKWLTPLQECRLQAHWAAVSWSRWEPISIAVCSLANSPDRMSLRGLSGWKEGYEAYCNSWMCSLTNMPTVPALHSVFFLPLFCFLSSFVARFASKFSVVPSRDDFGWKRWIAIMCHESRNYFEGEIGKIIPAHHFNISDGHQWFF